MNLPDWMIHQSFRYCLGRRTYAVQDFCDWCVKNWNEIPSREQNIIINELEDAFWRADDRQTLSAFNPLGMDIDRKQWERVRALYKD